MSALKSGIMSPWTWKLKRSNMTELLTELEGLIIEWAKARKIIPNASAETQLMKLYSEAGEFTDGILKRDLPEIKDAIGDMFVLLTVWNNLKWQVERADSPIIHEIEHEKEFFHDFMLDLNELFDASIHNNKYASFRYNVMIDYLASYAIHYELTLEECVESAYNEIKDRKGTLLPSGVYVKE